MTKDKFWITRLVAEKTLRTRKQKQKLIQISHLEVLG